MGRYQNPDNKLTPPTAKSFRCPSWLNDDAKGLWRDLAPRLLKLGVLCAIDRAAFEALCTMYGRMKSIERELAISNSLVSDGRKGLKKNPLESSYRSSCELFRKLAADFGITPLSRTRISITTDTTDELDDYLNGKISKIR